MYLDYHATQVFLTQTRLKPLADIVCAEITIFAVDQVLTTF